MKERKIRKAYPTLDERITMVEEKIDHLTKLNAERQALIEKTENTLNERKATLAKSAAQLEKALARKQRLMQLKNKPTKRAAKLEKVSERKHIDELLTILKAKGISVEDAIKTLKEE